MPRGDGAAVVQINSLHPVVAPHKKESLRKCLISVSGKGSNRKGKEEQGYCADCTKHGPRTWLELAFNARHAYNAMMDYGREMPSNNGMNGDVDDADAGDIADDEMRDGDEDAEI